MKEQKIQNLMNLDVEGRLKHIEQSFDSVKKTLLSELKHPTKKDVTALEMFPIFPDFEFWNNPYILLSYDGDPVAGNMKYATEEDRQIAGEESVLKPLSLPENPDIQWMAYYVPDSTTVQQFKRKRETDLEESMADEVYEERFYREFDISLKESTYPYFLALRKEDGGAFYNSLPQHIRLRKRRALVLFTNFRVNKICMSQKTLQNRPALLLNSANWMKQKMKIVGENCKNCYNKMNLTMTFNKHYNNSALWIVGGSSITFAL
jgi:hypothetical protein